MDFDKLHIQILCFLGLWMKDKQRAHRPMPEKAKEPSDSTRKRGYADQKDRRRTSPQRPQERLVYNDSTHRQIRDKIHHLTK